MSKTNFKVYKKKNRFYQRNKDQISINFSIEVQDAETQLNLYKQPKERNLETYNFTSGQIFNYKGMKKNIMRSEKVCHRVTLEIKVFK